MLTACAICGTKITYHDSCPRCNSTETMKVANMIELDFRRSYR